MDTELFKEAEALAGFFRTFVCARRILILWALDHNEMSVSQIASTIDASVQNTSQHLQLMKERGILVSRRQGQTVFYRIADPDLLQRYGLRLHHPG